jgi:prolyl 4-hydroxylase
MNSNPMYTLLERGQADASIEEASRMIFAKMDVDALVRLGADKGCFISRDDAASFIEVATFSSNKELTPEELETVAGGGLIYMSSGTSTTTPTSTPPPTVSEDRSSWQTHLSISHDPIVADIERRLAQHVNLPVEHGEGMQIIRYESGQEFKPHHDYFDPDVPGFAGSLENGGQRRTTVLMYLSEPHAGGETLFPAIRLKIKPTKGHALCFNNLNDDGSLDVNSLHGSLPVSAGEKWVATKWIRVGSTSSRS